MTPRNEKIVIIDDEKRMCDSLTALLEGEGYQVTSYQHSPEAVDAISQAKVDLVITDIKMPQMDGLEVLKRVKEIDDGIPVILLTGNASLGSAVDAIGQGAYDYLLKPIEFERLETVVNHALSQRQAQLERLHLVEELRLSNLVLKRRVGELNALYEAGKSIGSSANLAELLKQIVVLASTVTEANVGSIMLLDEQKEFLTIEAAIGLSDEIIAKTRMPIGASIAGYVAKTGEALMVEDVEQDERFKRINRERYGAASLLCTPLRIKNNTLGVINMANKSGDQGFNADDLRLLTTFAAQAAIAVDDAYQFEGSRRRLIEFEILHEIAGELLTIDSLTAFRKVLVEKLKRVFPVDYAIWFDWNPANECLIAKGALGDSNIPMTESGKIDLRQVTREALTVSEINLDSFDVNDINKFSRYLGEKIRKNSLLPEPNEAYMAVPIFRNGELAHVFYLGTDSNQVYNDNDVSLARLVISQAALLFEKERALLNATRLMTMGNMISEISHDLRRPLTSIKGGLQVLRQRWPEVVEDSDFFRMVEEEIHRMNELVRELVDFSNPNKYQTSKLDLRQVIRRAAELVKPDMDRRKVTFEADFDDANWELILSKNQIMEVFLNLFINAIEAMNDGGSLTIIGTTEKPPHRNQPYLAIKIKDTGVGIKKENLARMFDRYYTTKETGTGLGLAVVERIISAHNGTFHVDSTLGEGTTFTIYLPLAI